LKAPLLEERRCLLEEGWGWGRLEAPLLEEGWG